MYQIMEIVKKREVVTGKKSTINDLDYFEIRGGAKIFRIIPYNIQMTVIWYSFCTKIEL